MSDTQQSGWVYILRNPTIPNMVKIGSTFNDPAERAKQLSAATGVPTPFFVVRAFATRWPREVEEYIHKDHRHLRVRPNREFFDAKVTDDSHMASDSDYDAYYSLVIQNAIKYVDIRMEIAELRKRKNMLDLQLVEMWKQHERERCAFLDECQKRNYPEKWAEYKARLRLLREVDSRAEQS